MSEKDPLQLVLYIIVRKDLQLPPGKLAAQAGHAVQLAIRRSETLHSPHLAPWEAGSYAKVCLAIADGPALDRLLKLLSATELPHVRVVDEGRTVVEAGTTTCLGLGPLPRGQAEPYVKRLQLY